MLALIETSGLIGAYSAFEAPFREFLLEELVQIGLACWIAAPSRLSRRTLVPADENMSLKFRHENIVQQ